MVSQLDLKKVYQTKKREEGFSKFRVQPDLVMTVSCDFLK
jgi:hypothetical protein